LADAGVIAEGPVLDCVEYRAALWLHAEPLLRHQLGTAVLAPLLRQPPHTRRILAETMLAWLETRGSAPALAVRLGKHAQTVRYRLRRLHEIFGADLADAERCFEIYLVLRTGSHLWQDGRPGPPVSRPAADRAEQGG
ncbi:MAG TPA: helix-turn-helix domain-containing protein, partial [Jatrophihabitans sp.]|nr:helix-turn-helix domain-containing protein [Jatrophihabitans sp.]